MDSKLLRGTFILTIGTYISRILGMIYVFPFVALVGLQGSALFAYGYGQYTIFLSIATMGFPMAVSKFVAKYNEIGDYHTSRRMFKSGLLVMGIAGFVAFLVLFYIAPYIAPKVLGGRDEHGNTIEDVTMVIRMVSVALIAVPIMSLIRGFFQGNQSMGPTAVSQVIEQLVRVVFLLSATYIVIKMVDGKMATAVGFATFAAFVGALGGLVVLLIYLKVRKPYFDELLEKSKPQTEMTTKDMYKELLSYAGPFVFVGLAIPLYTYVDVFTFNNAMINTGFLKVTAEEIFGLITFSIPKLVMIPVSLATAFGLTLIPTITSSFTSGNLPLLRRQIDQTFQIIVLLVLPAVVGLAVLAGPAYATFYPTEGLGGEYGGFFLGWFAPVAILFSFFTVTAAILQGINKQKLAVISLVIGLLIKLMTNAPLIYVFDGLGSILATALGFTVSIAYSFWMIAKHTKYSFSLFLRRSVLMSLFALLMALTILSIQYLLSFVISYESGKIQAVTILLIGVIIGAGIYLYLAYKSRLLAKLLGARFAFLNRKKKQKAVH